MKFGKKVRNIIKKEFKSELIYNKKYLTQKNALNVFTYK